MFYRVVISRRKKKNIEHRSFPKLHLQNKRKGHCLSPVSQLQVNRPLSTQKRRDSFGLVEMFFHFKCSIIYKKSWQKNSSSLSCSAWPSSRCTLSRATRRTSGNSRHSTGKPTPSTKPDIECNSI